MRVSVVRGGGVAGLVLTTTLDEADLSRPEAERLRALVETALAGSPGHDSPGHGSRGRAVQTDRFDYELTVETPESTRRLRVGEADLPAETAELLAWVDAAPARRQQFGPPGPALP